MARKFKKTKEAKFYCESCGSQVPRNSKVCPTCGKFFASVRCPKCGRTGSNDDFKNGCPACGYAVNPDSLLGGATAYPKSSSSAKNIKFKNNSGSNFSSLFNKSNKRKSYSSDSLPVWVYISTVLVLIILVILLYSCL